MQMVENNYTYREIQTVFSHLFTLKQMLEFLD